MSLHLGTSGWAYTAWKPGFYKASVSPKRFLEFYATKFNSVEVNYTFSRPLGVTPELARRWMEQVPEGFRFSFKAPRQVTHSRDRLQHSDLLKRFMASLAPIRKQDKFGVVLFQLAPTTKCDAPLLRSFLRKWPKGVRAAFEFRHASWFTEEVFGILKRSNVALCVAESDELVTPDVVTSEFAYYRYRLSKYPTKALAERAARIDEHLSAGREVYAYMKHIESPISPRRALAILRRVGESECGAE